MLRRMDYDALVGAGLLLVLASADWRVVVFGLLWLLRAERKAEGSLQLEAAARAAMLGGFVGRMVLMLVPVLLLGAQTDLGSTLLFGELPKGESIRQLDLNLLGKGLLVLVQSFLLGFSVRCIMPRLAA